MTQVKQPFYTEPDDASGRPAAGNDLMLSGAGIRRLQAERGEDPCFGTEMRFQCQRVDCHLACRCMSGLVAHWKR
jgi:hypothetical protein